MTAVEPTISIENFENAVHRWFSESTGLEVIWQNQSKPRPYYPYGSLLISNGPEPVSPLWELREDTDLDRPQGTEIETIACVHCQFVVSCQAYVDMEDANNPVWSALQYMTRAQGALSLPSWLSVLRAVGISVVNRSSILNVSEVIKDARVSRVNMDVIFGASLNAVEYAGYIAKVELKSNSLGIDTIVSI